MLAESSKDNKKNLPICWWMFLAFPWIFSLLIHSCSATYCNFKNGHHCPRPHWETAVLSSPWVTLYCKLNIHPQRSSSWNIKCCWMKLNEAVNYYFCLAACIRLSCPRSPCGDGPFITFQAWFYELRAISWFLQKNSDGRVVDGCIRHCRPAKISQW